jgi:hypothetical protein
MLLGFKALCSQYVICSVGVCSYFVKENEEKMVLYLSCLIS